MKKIFLTVILLSALGCAEKKEKMPAGLLPPAKLTSILADIHIAESQIENMHVSPDTAKVVFNRLQKDILKKQNVSEKDFNKTYDYYINHLTALDKVYEGLVDTLGVREIKITAKGKK